MNTKKNKLKKGERKFKVWRNYLYHYARFIKSSYNNNQIHINNNLKKILENRQNSKPTTLTTAGVDYVERMLINAWNTELVNSYTNNLSNAHVISINHWKPTFLYYSIYSMLNILFYLHNKREAEHHREVLSFLSKAIKNNNVNLCPPWDFMYALSERNKYINFPKNYNPETVSPWGRNIKPIHSIGMWLRTTSEKYRDYSWKEKSKKKRKKLKKKSKLYIKPMSLFDCLFRFRLWVNYNEAKAILEGQKKYRIDSKEFYEDIDTILKSTLFCLEYNIMQLLGSRMLKDFYNKFINTLPSKADKSALESRINLICR